MLWYVNEDYRARHKNDGITVEFVSVTEAEMDEMGSFVGDTSHQCWLWWAIDHTTGEPLAFHFGTGEHETLDTLLSLLRPFAVSRRSKIIHSSYEGGLLLC